MNIEKLETKLYTMLSSYAESLDSYDNRFFINTSIQYKDGEYQILILLVTRIENKLSKMATALLVNDNVSKISYLGNVINENITNTMVEIIKSCRPLNVKENETNE